MYAARSVMVVVVVVAVVAKSHPVIYVLVGGGSGGRGNSRNRILILYAAALCFELNAIRFRSHGSARYDAGWKTFLSLLINCLTYVAFSNDILHATDAAKNYYIIYGAVIFCLAENAQRSFAFCLEPALFK